jgi:hypothetical protein
MKNPLTPAGIELATVRFVAQRLNHCATLPRSPVSVSSSCLFSTKSLLVWLHFFFLICFRSLRKRKAFFLFCEQLYESHIPKSSGESPPLLYDVQLLPQFIFMDIHSWISQRSFVNYQYRWRSNRCSQVNVCPVSTVSSYRYYSFLDFQFKYE